MFQCERLPLETGSITQLISAVPPAVPAPAVSDVNIHHVSSRQESPDKHTPAEIRAGSHTHGIKCPALVFNASVISEVGPCDGVPPPPPTPPQPPP